MIKKTLIFLILFSCMLNVTLLAQDSRELSSNSLATDSTIRSPEDFDNNLNALFYTWLAKRTNLSNCHTTEAPEVSDSIVKLRLTQLPCVMEMPFNSKVRAFIDLYTVKKRHQMEFMMGMSKYYFPIFEEVLGANNLPLELKCLPVIESALNTTIVSPMGAAGLWQFMIATGRMYNLEINSLVDERLSPAKATKAAARFLKDLYSMYGDWHLVIAAYNCGPGNVNKAIRRAGGKRDYWAIYPYLPEETRGYVPIFIAATYSMHYAAQHGICAAEVELPVVTDTIMVRKQINLQQIASVLEMPIEEVRLLNAQYKRDIVPGHIKPYPLTLPIQYVNLFHAKVNQILEYNAEELLNARRSEVVIPERASAPINNGSSVKYHKVKRGQTLSEIAARHGVSVSKLKKWNRISGSTIRPGQTLIVRK